MKTKVKIQRLPTGVPGLDFICGGGLPEYSFNLIAGEPGSGKTTLAHQIMFSLATVEKPALFLTILGEPPVKMLRYQQQFEFFDETLIGNAINFVNLSEDTISGNLERVLLRITEEVVKHKPSFIFIDSFRSVVRTSIYADDAKGLEQFVQQLGITMTSWKATTFLIGEYPEPGDINPVFTVADGLIWLRQSSHRNSMVRKIEIVKMRGQASVPGLYPFRITDQGLKIFSPQIIPTSIPTNELENRATFGITALDDMLGGGLPQGFSLLIAGPSGSGKSILAASFLEAGTKLGEHGIIASFEQRPSKKGRNAVVSKLLDEKKISIINTGIKGLSVNEILTMILDEIKVTGATRIVIDSLSGLELALASDYREDFRESMLELVTTLTEWGMNVIMTCELEDRYSDLRFSPYGTAFLTDAIIVQRYIELTSRLRRVIAVVKLRGSPHSDELREYIINEEGILIGEILADQEGLLGGRPTQKSG